MDVERKKLHQSIGKLLDDEIPTSSQFYATFSNFASVYLSPAQLDNKPRPSHILRDLTDTGIIQVGNYKELLTMLDHSRLIRLKKSVEDIAGNIRKYDERMNTGIQSHSKPTRTAASIGSPQPVNQLSINLSQQSKLSINRSQQSRQHLVFNIIQKSSACKDWKNLGRELGLENSAIDSITLDNANNVQEQCYQMLLRWRQTQPASRATPDVLIKALERIDCKSVTEEIKVCLTEYIIEKPFDE